MTQKTPNRAVPSEGIGLLDSPGLMAPAGHYSHVATCGGLAFVSGQLPVTPEGEILAGRPFDVQVRQVLRNIDCCLEAAGTTRERLVSVTVFVADMRQWPGFDVLYGSWLGAHRPARIVAGVAALHHGAALEMQAIAALA